MSEKIYYTFATKDQLIKVGVDETKITECVIVDDCKLSEAEMSLEQCKKLIPEGPYCYDKHGVCKFWDLNKQFPTQNNGYCHFLNRGDWQLPSIGLLWDQCKECGIKEHTDNYEE